MIEDLLQAWPVDPARSLVVGDSPTDMQAAAAAGLRGALFRGGRLDKFISDVTSDLLRPARSDCRIVALRSASR